MSDWSEQGAIPVEDAAVPNPPTVDEVMEEQRRRDDLPDPSDDPHHQQVVDDEEAASADLAVANDAPPEARPDVG